MTNSIYKEFLLSLFDKRNKLSSVKLKDSNFIKHNKLELLKIVNTLGRDKSESIYLLLNNFQEIPTCPVCKINKKLYINYPNGYRDTCGYSCSSKLYSSYYQEDLLNKQKYDLSKFNSIIDRDKEFILNELLDINGGIASTRISSKFFDKFGMMELYNKLQNMSNNFVESVYIFMNDIKEYPKCENCGKDAIFYNFVQGFRPSCGDPKCFLYLEQRQTKRKETCLERYGVEHFTQQENYKEYFNREINSKIDYKTKNENKRNTCLERYGVYHISQVSWIHEKQQKYKWKDYILPSGKIIKIQGYENYALYDLLKIYNEDEIITQRKDIPTIWYITPDKKKHRYFADFWIPKDNLIVEVKSEYTLGDNIEINLLKFDAVLGLGMDLKVVVY